jgi:hypothetical protein
MFSRESIQMGLSVLDEADLRIKPDAIDKVLFRTYVSDLCYRMLKKITSTSTASGTCILFKLNKSIKLNLATIVLVPN